MSVDEVSQRERTISGALALGMHLLFLILLVVGISWQPKRSTAPVAVELWSELPPAPRKVQPPPEPEPEPAPPKQAPRPEPRPEPKPEVKPVPKPDIAIKEQLLKKKLQEEKIERERKLKEELEAKRRKEKELAEEKKREEEKKRLAEQKKREEEKKRLAEKQRQEELAKAAKEKEAAMQKLLAQQAAEAAAQGRLDAYSRLVADRIKRYIVEPPNLQGKPEAVFTVVQIPGGEIIDLRLKRSSGNPAYDAAAERAIRRASPFPPPPDPARFSEVRELELRIRPEDR